MIRKRIYLIASMLMLLSRALMVVGPGNQMATRRAGSDHRRDAAAAVQPLGKVSGHLCAAGLRQSSAIMEGRRRYLYARVPLVICELRLSQPSQLEYPL